MSLCVCVDKEIDLDVNSEGLVNERNVLCSESQALEQIQIYETKSRQFNLKNTKMKYQIVK